MTTSTITHERIRNADWRKHVPKFYTKAGWLTPYALACNYIEKRVDGPLETRLFSVHGNYVVEVFALRPGLSVREIGDHWIHFDKLSDARRWFNKAAPIVALQIKGARS